MAELSESEYRLLNALSETTPYSVPELAASAGLSARQVQRLVKPLAGDGRVTESWQDGRTEYRLSPTGVGQRTMMQGLMRDDGPVGLGGFVNALSTAKHHAGIAAHRERMADVPLTDQERSICSAALTWQHQQSRFDWSELTRRRALLNSAVTHGQLMAVFDGLQMPSLYGEQLAVPKGVPWNEVGFCLKVIFLSFFLLGGVNSLRTASDPEGYLVAVALIGGSLFFGYRAWRRAYRPDAD